MVDGVGAASSGAAVQQSVAASTLNSANQAPQAIVDALISEPGKGANYDAVA